MGSARDTVGVHILRNGGTLVRKDLFLAGIDDSRTGRPNLLAALAPHERRAGVPCVLLSHDPDVLRSVPETVDLTLCRHTYGSQVRLPGIGAPITSSRYGRPFVSRGVARPAHGCVSLGLGVTQLPVRFGCEPVLTYLTLLPV